MNDDSPEAFEALMASAFVPPPKLAETPSAYIDPKKFTSSKVKVMVRDYFGGVPKPTPEDADIHLYRLILWYEPRVHLPSITDGDRLQEDGSWPPLAKQFERILAARLGIEPGELPKYIDLVMRAYQLRNPTEDTTKKRANFSGFALEATMYHLLIACGFPANRIKTQVLIGSSRADIVLYGESRRDDDVIAILPLKWTLRHSRIKELEAEAPHYARVYPHARICPVTSEHDMTRLHLLLGHRREQHEKGAGGFRYHGVYHVSTSTLEGLHRSAARVDRLRSVADLLRELTT